MSTWTTATPGRRLAALAITAGLILGVAACSDGSRQQDRAPAAASNAGSSAPHAPEGRAGTPLAELQGQNGPAPTSAERNPAGYLTVRGDLKNDGAELTVVPAELRGNELRVLRTGPSLAGTTVVDFTRSKRYFVLRDTDGRPLTTTGLSTLKAGESVRVFMRECDRSGDRAAGSDTSPRLRLLPTTSVPPCAATYCPSSAPAPCAVLAAEPHSATVVFEARGFGARHPVASNAMEAGGRRTGGWKCRGWDRPTEGHPFVRERNERRHRTTTDFRFRK